ncbi:MAG TPA: hypothetical protein VGQ65_11480 [Thermoanaerobaculia bacterium]|jgi:hypothetical protein|nr:hypothetical protein [Thermoanaerobaculia bacterium]
MTRRFINCRPTFICLCLHQKREHWHTKEKPQGPCFHCGCHGYTPEPMCSSGHGKKAHARAKSKEFYLCGCSGFGEKTA